jgi:hypothetical protein
MNHMDALNAAVSAAATAMMEEATAKHATEVTAYKRALASFQAEKRALQQQVDALREQLSIYSELGAAAAKPTVKGKGKSSSNAASKPSKADDMETLARIMEDSGQDEIYRSFKDDTEVAGTWDAETKTITIGSADSYAYENKPIHCSSLSQFARCAGIVHQYKKTGTAKEPTPINGWKACYILSATGEKRIYLDTFRK